jgi:hypothetical protein
MDDGISKLGRGEFIFEGNVDHRYRNGEFENNVASMEVFLRILHWSCLGSQSDGDVILYESNKDLRRQ